MRPGIREERISRRTVFVVTPSSSATSR